MLSLRDLSRREWLRVGGLSAAGLTLPACRAAARPAGPAHSASADWVLPGYPHWPLSRESAKPGPPNDAPSLAGIVRHLRKDAARIPASVILPEHIRNNPNNPWPGQFGGWLGRAADPWLL